ncbi:YolD-like family protein [Halobacillus shinanisalinarum]|uniref:YolD-like family protein n=1 Tax=Halobacillus shinanisalinarum TaxID=2932258 RepID=A0ABY4H5Y2_9BACI|nr:YolD-like family protein [Halobacillus shinanisalinarum]UOQ94997.1 YolD-like family protein [Halobacillus shinanisalinarum]
MDQRNHDRGTIKWTSLMLPEHVELIKRQWKEDQRVEKGIIDEQKAVEIDFILQRALHDGLTVNVKVHNGFDYEHIRMKITYMNKLERKVFGKEEESKEVTSCKLDDISDITIV